MEAMLWERLDPPTVKCNLCGWRCTIIQGQRGRCGVRENVNGTLFTLVYGKVISYAVDPIEKKPLYRYHPGEYILSLGTKGCNFHCDFCQNWHISQELDAPTQDITSAEAVKKAGTTDVAAVIKAWEGLSYDGPAGLWTMRACDHQAQVPYWAVEIVKENKFFKHAFEGPVTEIPAKDVEVSCAETGCKMSM